MAGQRFIFCFRQADRPGPGSGELHRRLAAIAAEAGTGPLEWQRRLATGADLVIATAPLDAATAARLLERAGARRDMEYAEADAMLTIASGNVVVGGGEPPAGMPG